MSHFNYRDLIIFAIIAYYNLLFLYIIVSILQSLAGMRAIVMPHSTSWQKVSWVLASLLS